MIGRAAAVSWKSARLVAVVRRKFSSRKEEAMIFFFCRAAPGVSKKAPED
jgi:hypothetical protein